MPKKTKVEVISDGRDIFVVVDGLKIAKRGTPDETQIWDVLVRNANYKRRLKNNVPVAALQRGISANPNQMASVARS